ncbi:hypothetical protein N7540_008033 [Penicillium herquei]|nr:hypothetical protein N7540_008033 [Penicillium herquei]
MFFHGPLSYNTSALDIQDPIFHACWRRQSCSECLSGDIACSWCAISSTCVPNAARVPILAPIGSDQICPLGSKERWELRARPLGCNVSTLTALSTTVAILSTLALLGVISLIIWLAKRIRRRMKQTEYERLDESDAPWWRRLTRMDMEPFASFASLFGLGQIREQETNRDAMEEDQEDGERRPLLESR